MLPLPIGNCLDIAVSVCASSRVGEVSEHPTLGADLFDPIAIAIPLSIDTITTVDEPTDQITAAKIERFTHSIF